MTDDYRVTPRSNLEVRQLAKKTRNFFGVADARRVDVLCCLRRPTIWTVRGEQKLSFQIRSDTEMGEDDGCATYDKGLVTVSVKRSVYHDAFLGHGRARNTLAHELGHAVMHDRPQMARRSAGNVTPKWLLPFESAEHQAKVFAPTFLINDAIAITLSSAEEISIEFGISLESALIYQEQMAELRNREQNSERMRRLAEELRVSSAPAASEIRYMTELCTICKNATVFPIGSKFMCETCHTVFDRFQDGDPGGF